MPRRTALAIAHRACLNQGMGGEDARAAAELLGPRLLALVRESRSSDLQAWDDVLQRAKETGTAANSRVQPISRLPLPRWMSYVLSDASMSVPLELRTSLQEGKARFLLILGHDGKPANGLAVIEEFERQKSAQAVAAAALLGGQCAPASDATSRLAKRVQRVLAQWSASTPRPPLRPPDCKSPQPSTRGQQSRETWHCIKSKQYGHLSAARLSGRLHHDQVLAELHGRELFRALSLALDAAATQEPALVVYCCVMLQIPASKLSAVSLSEADSSGAWLDLSAGCLRVSLASLRAAGARRHAEDARLDREHSWRIAAVPWPKEIVDVLRLRAAAAHGSTLADLLQTHDPAVRRNCRDLLRAISVSSWLATPLRVMLTAPRLCMRELGDELTTDVVFAGAQLAQRASYHYYTIEPHRMLDAAQRAWRTIGLSGDVLFRPTAIGAMVEPPDSATFSNAIRVLYGRACGLARQRLLHARPITHLERVGRLAVETVALLALMLALRGQSIQHISRSSFAVNLETREGEPYRGFLFVGDKYRHDVRVVPLDRFTAALVRQYIACGIGTAYALRNSMPQMAELLLQHLDVASTKPLFVMYEAGIPRSVSAQDIRLTLDEFKLRRNDGRRALPSALLGRDAEVSSVVVNAIQGRAESGQEPFSAASALKPVHVCTDWARRTSVYFENMALAEPRVAAGRWPREIRAQAPLPRTLASGVGRDPSTASPFTRSDGALLELYVRLAKSLAAHPPSDPWVLLAFLVVYEGGTCTRGDLDAILSAVAARGIDTEHDGKLVIRYRTKASGARELVAAGPLSVSLLQARPPCDSIDAVLSRMSAECAIRWKLPTQRGLDILLDAASVIVTLFCDGLTREIMAGRMSSRPLLSATASARKPTFFDRQQRGDVKERGFP